MKIPEALKDCPQMPFKGAASVERYLSAITVLVVVTANKIVLWCDTDVLSNRSLR